VLSELKSDWIVGWDNIIKKEFVGDSHGYTCEQTAIGTTNGAGGRNVQLFMISGDGVVVHALAGYWHPDDLVSELKFAREKLLPLWQDTSVPRHMKDSLYAGLQVEKAASNSKLTRMRSRWQGFDAKNEMKRFEKNGARDSVLLNADGSPLTCKKGKMKLKTLDVLQHDRMATRPFVPFAEFDVMAFADYGRTYYDNNKKVDGAGQTFMTPTRVAKAEKKAAKKAAKVAKRAKRKAAQLANRAAQKAKRDRNLARKMKNKRVKKQKAKKKVEEEETVAGRWF
jgi:hypothetical protein